MLTCLYHYLLVSLPAMLSSIARYTLLRTGPSPILKLYVYEPFYEPQLHSISSVVQ